jgi:hypothetical protein
MKKPEYEVVIYGADNGITVRIGCKTVVGTENMIDEMLADLKLYLIGGNSAQYALREKWFGENFEDYAQNACAPVPCVERSF